MGKGVNKVVRENVRLYGHVRKIDKNRLRKECIKVNVVAEK